MFEIKNAEDIMEAKSINNEADKVLDSLIDKLYKLLSVEKFPYRPELLNFRKYEYHLEKEIIVETEINGRFYNNFDNQKPIIIYSFNKDKLKEELKTVIKEDEEIFFFVQFGEFLSAGPVLCERNGNKITPILLEQRRDFFDYPKCFYHIKDYYIFWESIWYWCGSVSFQCPTSKEHGFLRLLKDNSLEFDEEKTQSVLKDIEGIMDTCLNYYFDI